MFKSSRFALILGLAGALAGLPCMAAAEKDPDAAGVAEAIRYEKAKQAAADRQARIEEASARHVNAATGSKVKPKIVKSAAVTRNTPPAHRNSQ